MSTKIRVLKKLDATVGRLLANMVPAGKCEASGLIQTKKVLFIRPGGIGDAVLLVPAILSLERRFPNLIIHVLAERRNVGIFSLCPAVARVFRYDVCQEIFAVFRSRYDVVIDTEQWHRLSAVVARLTGAPLLIGYATNERQKLFTHPIQYSQDHYEVESFYHLLAPLHIVPPYVVPLPFLQSTPDLKLRASELLGQLVGSSFVVIFSGASIPERRWGADRFRQVVARLAGKGIPIVVIGGKEDAADGAWIIDGSYGLNLAGRISLEETAAVIEKAAVLVSGDSGILHIGVGLDKPTVSLFGPGIAAKWAPRGEKHIVLNKELSCSPCTTFGHTPSCPISARCLAEITVEEVVEAVEKYFAMSAVGRL